MADRHRPHRPSGEEATRDLVGRVVGPAGPGYWIAVAVLAVLAAAGVAALVILAAGGPEPRARWGYAAATLAFLLSTAQAAPILAFVTRAARGFWGISLRRCAELLAVAGLVTAPLYILLLFQLPEWRGRPSIWFDWPGAPHLWDSVAIVLFSLLGLALVWLSSLPDLAAVRDARPLGARASGPPGARLSGMAGLGTAGGTPALPGARRRRGDASLSLNWSGTIRQWQVLSGGIVVLGAFYLMLYTVMHVFLVSDLAMSLVPGWKSAIIPPYHAVSGLQGGVAATLVALALLRRFGRLERYIDLDPFWGAAKPLLALALLFFYFTWSELLATWYGRTPEEIQLLTLTMFGPYLPHFALSFLLNFVLPFGLLIWNRVRVSIGGPTLVAALVLLGNLVDRVRIYVAAWSVAGPPGQHLEHVPDAVPPGPLDVLVVLGALSAVGLLFLLALRLVPGVSLWEFKYGLLLKVERPYGKARVMVVAKPR